MLHRLFTTIFLSFITTTASFAQTPTDKQILERVYQTYRTARTYQDSGTVTTHFLVKTPDHEEDSIFKKMIENGFGKLPQYKGHTSFLRFQTAYVRATGQFRFNYWNGQTVYKDPNLPMSKTTKHCYTIVCDGKITRTWWEVRPKNKGEVSESLTFALAAATGISSTSSRKIPGLLLAEPIGAGWEIQDVKDWQRISDGKQAGRDCYRFKGTGYTKIRAILYIDKATWLVLRIDEASTIPDANVYSVMQYKPILNQTVAPSALLMREHCESSK
jgi:hypothetical protein